ncbi:SDR family NAD(P)-dependent oxidoreductase [Luteolibacter arcticus]|uniref:SDR family NAD(P)-dependent oxidoreductase n=1 Tax=Luteolibacter arcticus TaxID=1581411 RepID=A0ABT3GIA0_9BACT|nr:SDR family NAD(P)-dependent oxidoreductase [Luteolibacter arcticus]MCW1923226.1 SDR family NAD(P)-dependent oxidoreductase [Luteolibacter arcticus]
MSSPDGPIVLVTGASSGIGRALSEMLVNRGAAVLGVTRRPESLPPGVAPIQADLTKRDEILEVFNHLGRINALVNCAGVAYLARISDGNPTDWEEMWRVNVMALALCCQLSLRHFPKQGGRIVNVSSMSGHRVPPTGGFYAPTKFAVRAITDALRNELKATGSPVQVACVSPGFVDTPLLDQYFRGREDALRKTRDSMTMLKPEDVALSILSILEAPTHVEIGDILMRSSDQQA